MALDVNEFARRYEFEFEPAALGRLHCRDLSVGVLIALEKLLADKNLTGRPFVVRLLEEVAERVPEAKEGSAKAEQEGTRITADEADQLTDDEVEAFAREFLTHNPSLFHTFEDEEHRTDERGKRVLSKTPRPADLPKEPGESDSDYLARIMRRYLDGYARKLKTIMKPLLGLSKGLGLTKSTQNALRKNLFRSDRLREAAGVLHTSASRIMETPPIEIPENPIFETNRRLNDVLDHMDEMRPLVGESANLIASMNDTLIRMLVDFGRSARRAETHNRIIIGVATLSIMATVVFSVLNYTGNQTAAAQSNRLIERFIAQMPVLSEAQDKRTERLVTDFQILLSKQSARDRRALVDALKRAIERLQPKSPPAGKPPDSGKVR